jgi:putative salt-induced outer membrane protein YdiY
MFITIFAARLLKPTMSHRSLVLMLACAWSAAAHAIVNVEDMRIGAPRPGFSGQVNVAVSGKSGNTDKAETQLNAHLRWHREQVTNLLVAAYDYAETNAIRDTNNSLLHARHVRQTSVRRAWELFAQWEENQFARLSFRGLLGAGARLTLLESAERLSLHLGIGAFYAEQRLDTEPGISDEVRENFWRANFYLAYKHRLNEQLRLQSTTYYQPRLDDGANFRALEQAALMVKMTDKLSLRISLDIAHDSRPPETVEQTDVSYTTGLSYDF